MDKKQSLINIVNGHVIIPDGMIRNGSVLVRDGIIISVSDHDLEMPGAMVLDAGGRYISPGFIDIHVHGGGGYDFMDNTVEAFLEIAKTHARYGTTALFPTTLTGSTEDIVRTLKTYDEAYPLNESGSEFMGIHLEGPYFAMNQRGAQDPRWIRDPDPKEYEYIVSQSGSIKRWSAAPELEGGYSFCQISEVERDPGILGSYRRDL